MNDLKGPVPILFTAIFSLIFINILVNLSLYAFSKIKNIRTVCWYWVALMATYLLQGGFQKGELPIALGFSMTFLPVAILSKILFDSISEKFPLQRYLTFLGLSLIVTPLLHYFSVPFRLIALPICIAISAPFIESAYYIFTRKRNTTSVLQKLMAIEFILSAVHVFNFAIFRMIPGTEVFGFGTALILYQIMSITLFAFAFEEYSKAEKVTLQKLVEDRTAELSQSNSSLAQTLRIKETLFQVVVHDIANPVQAQKVTVDLLEKHPQSLQLLLPKLVKFNSMIMGIINQVKTIELIKDGKLILELYPVNVEECLRDVAMVFEEQLKEKRINFFLENELAPNTKIEADPVAFTNSVMNNLISNAIKFSKEDSELKVRATCELNGKVVIEVKDQGIGMSPEFAGNIFNPLKKTTRTGTKGEKGSGYGLALVKSYVDYFGGKIDIESKPIDLHPLDHGTTGRNLP